MKVRMRELAVKAEFSRRGLPHIAGSIPHPEEFLPLDGNRKVPNGGSRGGEDEKVLTHCIVRICILWQLLKCGVHGTRGP